MTIIGLTGHSGAGKDTLAESLPRATNVKFSSTMKAVAAGIAHHIPVQEGRYEGDTFAYVIDREGIEGLKGVPGGLDFLKDLGLAMRAQDRDCLVRPTMEKIDAILAVRDGHALVFVTDVRFPNEASAIRKAGGLLGRVTRPDHESSGGETESYIDTMDVDFEIVNDGTPAQLRRRFFEALDGAR